MYISLYRHVDDNVLVQSLCG